MDARSLVIDILQYTIQLIVLLVMGFLITYLKTKTGAEQAKEYYDTVKRIVMAAEQVFGPKMGNQKKDFVIQILKNKLPYFEEDEIANLVEAAVFEMNVALKRLEDTPG